MNDRMTELYAKACLDARDIHPADVPAFIECMAEKLSESIVRECADMVSKRPYVDDGVSIYLHPSTIIKKHFGVEE